MEDTPLEQMHTDIAIYKEEFENVILTIYCGIHEFESSAIRR